MLGYPLIGKRIVKIFYTQVTNLFYVHVKDNFKKREQKKLLHNACLVAEALQELGGPWRNRTAVDGFADR